MTRSLRTTPVRSRGRRGVAAGLFLGLALLLSGCLKYDLMLLVNEDDTMDGTLIVAVAREFAVGEDIFGQSGDPTPSQGSVTKEAYEDADYIGSRYIFSGVPISEIDAFASDNSTRFSLTHEGDEYVLDASLNFSLGGTESLPTDGSFSALVAITFPGAVIESNGTVDGNTVTWTQLRPGAENPLTARASAIANGQAGSPLDSGIAWWIWAVGAAAALAVAGIIAAVVLRRRRAAKSAKASAEMGTWQAQQQGGYDEHGNWVGTPGNGQQSGYYDSGQQGGYDSYYGTYGDGAYGDSTYGDSTYGDGAYGDSTYGDSTYGDATLGGSYGDSYGGPPGTEPYPKVGQPHGGYSGQTVVSGREATPPPEWSSGPTS